MENSATEKSNLRYINLCNMELHNIKFLDIC